MATGLRKKITYEEAINNINPDGSIKGNKKIAYVERSASKFIKSYEYNKLLNADPVDLDNVTLDSRKREEMIKELNEREESTAEQIEESHQKWEARKQEKKRNTIQRMQEKQPKPTPIEAMASADEPEIKPKPKAKSTPMEEPEVQVEPKGKRGRPRKSAEASSSFLSPDPQTQAAASSSSQPLREDSEQMFRSLTKKQLENELRQRGLRTSGRNKEVLIQRLLNKPKPKAK